MALVLLKLWQIDAMNFFKFTFWAGIEEFQLKLIIPLAQNIFRKNES